MDLSLFQGELAIVIVQEHEVSSLVMGYHEYRKTWVPIVGETLQCQMEPDNVVDKYAVAVINKSKVVGHLMNGKSGKFAKTVFFFLRADTINSATVEITGNPSAMAKAWESKSHVESNLLVVKQF